MIGCGDIKTLVDPGDFPERNEEFVANLDAYLTHHTDVKINRILVTHGHFDHFGGVYDTIKLLQERNRSTQDLKVFKYLTDNEYEQHVFERYPQLRQHVHTIGDRQIFEVEDGLSIEAMLTPGHLDDHMSFLIREKKTLVTGDIILGAPSTSI